MTFRTILAFIVGISFSVVLWAEPAPWYKWHNPSANYEICAQTPPGDGWEVVKGPFQDSQCKKLGVPSKSAF